MSITRKQLDLTDKDFDSLRARARNLIRSAFPTWTDENVANFGNILVELMCHVGDVLGFYIDNNARESRWSTANQRKNLIGLAKLIGYKLPGATAATVNLTITAENLPANDVPIPKGTIVKTEEVTDAIEFQTLADATILAGTSSIIVAAEHSKSFTDSFVSTGKANQRFTLAAFPYLDGSAAPTATNGAYTQVDNFLGSSSSDRHFAVVVDQNDRATIVFGNGISGEFPVGTVTIPYKTGGGAEGSIEAGKIKRVVGNFTDLLGNTVRLTATNPSRTDGGTDRVTVQQARLLAPQSIDTISRTVSRDDYENNAMRVAGVARALMLTADEDPGIMENHGQLYVIPVGGGLPADVLKNAVKTMVTVTYPQEITFQLEVMDPLYLPINIYSIVYFGSVITTSAQRSAVRAAALASLQAYFAIQNADGTPNENVDFGFNYKDADGNPAGEIALSDIYNIVRDTPGIRKMGDSGASFTLNDEHKSVPIAVRQFPTLGTFKLIDGATGLEVT